MGFLNVAMRTFTQNRWQCQSLAIKNITAIVVKLFAGKREKNLNHT